MINQDETIYGTELENDTIGLSSERVHGLATSIYKEFERMINRYDEDVVKDLMPLVVTILENLDKTMTDYNESIVEIELLKDDKEQLTNQFERERQLRRLAEHRLIENDDTAEITTRCLRERALALEGTTRQLELKCQNHIDQVERLQERESELKREYNELHQRHTGMIQSYVEHIERTKSLHQFSGQDFSQSQQQSEKETEGELETFPGTPSTPLSCIFPITNQAASPSSQTCSVRELTLTPDFDRSNQSMQDEIKNHLFQTNGSKKEERTSVVTFTPEAAPDSVDSDHNGNGSCNEYVPVENITPGNEKLVSEASDWLTSDVEGLLELPNLYLPKSLNAEMGNSKESIKLETKLEGNGIENAAFNQSLNVNESSLFSELSKQDLGDVDDGADILGMGKEVENLILENTKLLATKNALNVVKDDLIHQVDQLTSQLTMLQEELEKSVQAKEWLHTRVKELESELAMMRKQMTELENENLNNSSKNHSEESIPMSQRKRFTRVEMARVLMERNQYKERLMELQEAVRWTEMLRASRDHPELNPQLKNKNKSSIFQFFSRLFSSGNSTSNGSTSPSKTSHGLGRSVSGTSISNKINMSYSVPDKIAPKSHSGSVFLYGRSPTIEIVQDSALESDTGKSRSMPVSRHPERMQACGWSLPGAGTALQDKSRIIPVPVFCRPLLDSDKISKLWCATSVNISIGKTRDGGLIVGTGSVFYPGTSAPSACEDSERKFSSQSSLESLDEELDIQTRNMKKDTKQREALSSLVWIVTSNSNSGQHSNNGNTVHVLDARDPAKSLQEFCVGSADNHILCITSIAGVQEDDYSCSQEVEVDSHANLKSTGTDFHSTAFSTDTDDVATEVTELTETVSSNTETVVVMEHIFTDPLGVHHKNSKLHTHDKQESLSAKDEMMDSSLQNENLESVQSREYVTKILSPSSCSSMSTNNIQSDQAKMEEKLIGLQPTIWMGSQSGCLYVHSAISSWNRCLYQIRLKDSIFAIAHIRGRALVALADGTVAIFLRNSEGAWDLSNYHLLDLGRPHHSVRCMIVVFEKVWCGYRNKIKIINPKAMEIETTFNAHPRNESQVRDMAWAGDGVWVSIRLDSTLRLYHARTFQHLQDVDVEPYVSKVLGSGRLGFSFVRITALEASQNRLWIGTGNGVVISVPLSENSKSPDESRNSSSTSTSGISSGGPGGVIRVYSVPQSERVTPGTYIPYCSMANAQLSFHGHQGIVKFFVSVPGCVSQPSEVLESEGKSPGKLVSGDRQNNLSSLVMSGGEGYVDFRLCDESSSKGETLPPRGASNSAINKSHSHIIVWQLSPA